MGGDAPAPPVSESTASMLAAYKNNLPDLLKVTAEGIQPFEQARLDANKSVAPAQMALQEAIYREFGPLLAQTSNQINASQAKSQAQSDLDVLNGPGGDLINKAVETQKGIDPEYYKTRTTTSNRLDDLLKSIDLSGKLSEGENEEASRALAQQQQSRGIANNPSQTAALQGAMTFGNLQHQRENESKNNLNLALQTANQALPALKSGIDTFQVGTGRSALANQGDNKFLGVDQNIGTQSGNLSGNLLNSVSGLTNQQNEINANRRDSLDRVNQTLGGIGSLI